MSSRRYGLLGRWLTFTLLILSCSSLFLSCGKVLGISEYDPRVELVLCDAKADPGTCGAAPNGEPMTCFAASQLGGEDYCVEHCDPSSASPAGFQCVGSGALLKVCTPGDANACPPGLDCFRTDITQLPGKLLYGERTQAPGLCIAMPVCSTHADCADHPTRRLCGGEVLREKYPDLERYVLTDHFQCVHGCDKGQGCPDGEKCLTVLDPELPAICVPGCETGSCPPNSFCLRDAGPGYPTMCIPGLPGFRCGADVDCMIGYCAHNAPGVSVCSISCTDDKVCGLLSNFRDPFLCVEGNCVSKAPFAGALCTSSLDCPSGETCSTYDAYHPQIARPATNLECHRACNEDGRCNKFGGLPYVCLPNKECYPADMGLPCKDKEECMGDLTCETIASPSDNDSTGVKICTKACVFAEDCVGYSVNPKICKDGFCQLPAP